MSPPELTLEEVSENVFCGNYVISTENQSIVEGKLFWAEPGFNKKILDEHVLTSEDLFLEATFKKEILINNFVEKEICVEVNDEQSYHGILLYKVKDKPVQIGIWVMINQKNGFNPNKIYSETKEVINDVPPQLKITTGLLICLFIFSIVSLKKKKRLSEFD